MNRKIDKFLSLKKIENSLNNEVWNRNEYMNPDLLFHQDNNQIGVPALATSGLPSIPTEIAARNGRPNKKSKWDKVFIIHMLQT
ncbi:hypothetical protein HID58_025585 [Brassica napus]|uniref:Uncharacterized protein n=1 Tax=Brassica napus TaxID=3708 RepID=A0ABQ8CLI6_BRANA|nr:hypothetical protein HID58_025585 [Brassica napus]